MGKATFWLVALALVLRIGYVTCNTDRDEHLLTDQITYLDVAQNIRDGKGIIQHEGSKAQILPVYPLFLVFFGPLTLIVQAFLSTATCVVIYYIGLYTFGRRVATWALAYSAVYPVYIFYCSKYLTETLFIFLSTYGVYLLLSGRRYFSPFLLAIATLCRATLLPFASIALFREKRSLVIFLLILCAWGVRNQVAVGSFTLSTRGGLNFYMGANPMATGGSIRWIDFRPAKKPGFTEVEANDYFFRLGMEYARDNPKQYATLALRKLLRLWRLSPHPGSGYRDLLHTTLSYLFHIPLFMLGIIGIVMCLRNSPGDLSLLYLILISTTIVHMVFNSSMRFQLPMIPFVTLFASYTVSKIQERFT